MQILINQIGYETDKMKFALLMREEHENIASPAQISLIYEGEEKIIQSLGPGISVAGWKGRIFHKIDFSSQKKRGSYFLQYSDGRKTVQSNQFIIDTGLIAETCLSDILFYFKSQRASGRWDTTDCSAPFYGKRKDRVDVHGGWYDASGDYSKYLSHLSYADYLNPQQTPLVTWALFKLQETLAASTRYGGTLLEERALEEGLHGADFLMRMQDPKGYFYVTVFDQWSKENEKRMISAFSGQEGRRSENYQAGFREGAGMAIAALARASRSKPSAGYLEAAVKGWDHLETNKTEYLHNGRENIIDMYCALIAAVELYLSTDEERFAEAARERASRLHDVYNYNAGYWLVEENSDRPFFHAAEAGMPIIALLEYLEIDADHDDDRNTSNAKSIQLQTRELVIHAVKDLLSISQSRSSSMNPFLLVRQWVKPVDGNVKISFFMPHENETGYWWQGENARLASLSYALRRSKSLFNEDQDQVNSIIDEFSDAQLHWILGMNPFDMCMLQGHGKNNPRYEDHYPNAPGGICNGITAGYENEEDIDFLPEIVEGRGDHRWRWSEQWIPHAAWFLLAVSADAENWKS
ncbi:MAG: glycoside hydrolase family 9 protein [Spirochaetales bacterium]|nr:glycoside hydrolase family 9 protein [Spirochaetales bacterium]